MSGVGPYRVTPKFAHLSTLTFGGIIVVKSITAFRKSAEESLAFKAKISPSFVYLDLIHFSASSYRIH